MATHENGSGKRELEGKRALVTGGSRGIGAAVVRRLLEAGAEVLTTARSASSAVPEGATFVAADVRTRAGAEALAAAAQEMLGGVDILVHNAGGARPYKGSSAIPDEEWQEALDLNFLASVRLDSLLTPGMRKRRSGMIVHVSSAVVPAPVAPFLHYTAAKAALENYSRGLALELAPFGIRVNTVSPGRTATPGGEETREQWARLDAAPDQNNTVAPDQNNIVAPDRKDTAGANQDNSTVPLGRDGRPDDIAHAVLFLVSEQASWLTGSNLVVDGGEFHRG
ncbi:SDR family oxidoreductase [Streptomyces yunnanensis]|uniref:SDR family oxidoreductase n=1 Tax=Streptomyces yunnanensis TaxID=156453 RepID=A0ABY8A4X9_9ACTN|nr:SDR family oxidoreductase [Streptomyces yunnanensis]WEB38607.1 SDR family oxidoreductase [Streptomyces yunnanensis]